MIINGKRLLAAAPFASMEAEKKKAFGMSYGLSEVGYDIRMKQKVEYMPPDPIMYANLVYDGRAARTHSHYQSLLKQAYFGYTLVDSVLCYGCTALASSVEEFQVPNHLWGELRNKSTIARQFVDATIGTDAEPGFKGFLTIEIIFKGIQPITFEAGSPIAKAVFHEISEEAAYKGKYQNQEDKPVEFILES